jgi:spermidine/putrescine transport system ATP-binding protein
MAELSAIEIRGVSKYYGYGEARFAAVNGANLSIRQNEFFTLLGPSGMRQDHVAKADRRV